ncbi:hypothetical protein B0P06_004617 [Clostridium saccharoperbutylacetonicum]|nr:hypothetical protein [Clostridium saccharoperbutylacetonicum]NRT62146.1 hypothetical protein [Clostridium saccharoperbutylacetonicum]NSB25476.1 hypothetical protein [Clostridium saccharoperbutylacetonicum]NSB44846.1 hypothetical protein [Clostridium saccharoperbutylacetonicum]
MGLSSFQRVPDVKSGQAKNETSSHLETSSAQFHMPAPENASDF